MSVWWCCRHCSSGSVDGKRQPFGLESDLNVRTLSLDSRRQGSMVLARVMRQLSRSSTSKRGTPFSTADKDKEASKVRQAFGVLRLKMASVAVGQHECVVVFFAVAVATAKSTATAATSVVKYCRVGFADHAAVLRQRCVDRARPQQERSRPEHVPAVRCHESAHGDLLTDCTLTCLLFLVCCK